MSRANCALVVLLAVVATSAATDEPRKPFVPTSAYESRSICGWSVRVNSRLLNDEQALGQEALELLERKLSEIGEKVPAGAVEKLRKVTIWLGVDDGHAPCAEYHPSRAWLVSNGYNPDKAKCVEIGNARRFIDWSDAQPSMVLHELAHAYHDQVLGNGNAEIAAAFKRVKSAGFYDNVRHVNGEETRHYALTNAQEYFAELTESCFGRNDFFPFTRAELREVDPESAELVESLWNLKPAPVEKVGRASTSADT